MSTTTEFFVDGMHCGSCVRRVQATLSAVPGVQTVEVNGQQKTAKITTDTPIQQETLAAVLEAEGYHLRPMAG